MDNTKRISELKGNEYQALFGVKKSTFEAMLTILEDEFERLHNQGGRPPRLSVLDKLVVTLGYYREYRTMNHIGFDYGVSKSRISDAVKWVEDTLLKNGTFSLPSKRELLKSDTEIEVVIIDVTEQETERPQKNKANPIPASKSVTQSKNS